MQSYIEIKVPIRWEEPWFEDLRDLLDGVNIRWQRGYYHITMAFLDDSPRGVDLITGLNNRLHQATAPTITFDKLHAFATGGGRRQVIHLTTTKAPAGFLALVEDIRSHFKAKGCTIQSAFRLHVTLGRVDDPRMNVRKLLDIISEVDLPATTPTLRDVEFRIFRGKTLATWKLPHSNA